MATNSNDSKVELDINASPVRVWKALTEPEDVKRYMMGADLETDWKVGSPMVWRGEFKGRKFEDKGKVLVNDKPEHLAYTHFSASSGEADEPANYHEVHIRLSGNADATHIVLTQDKNTTAEAKKESEKNWKMMMEGLKKVVEEQPH